MEFIPPLTNIPQFALYNINVNQDAYFRRGYGITTCVVILFHHNALLHKSLRFHITIQFTQEGQILE